MGILNGLIPEEVFVLLCGLFLSFDTEGRDLLLGGIAGMHEGGLAEAS